MALTFRPDAKAGKQRVRKNPRVLLRRKSASRPSQYVVCAYTATGKKYYFTGTAFDSEKIAAKKYRTERAASADIAPWLRKRAIPRSIVSVEVKRAP